MKKKNRASSAICLTLLFVFLFAPILVLIVFSFNAGKSTVNMSGFSFRWYKSLFTDGAALQALRNSVILAVTLRRHINGDGYCRGIRNFENAQKVPEGRRHDRD